MITSNHMIVTTAVLAHILIRPHHHYAAARTTTSEKDIAGEEEMDMLKNWNDWMAPLSSDSDND